MSTAFKHPSAPTWNKSSSGEATFSGSRISPKGQHEVRVNPRRKKKVSNAVRHSAVNVHFFKSTRYPGSPAHEGTIYPGVVGGVTSAFANAVTSLAINALAPGSCKLNSIPVLAASQRCTPTSGLYIFPYLLLYTPPCFRPNHTSRKTRLEQQG